MGDIIQERLQGWSYRSKSTRAATRFGARALAYPMYAGVLVLASRRATLSAADLARPVAAGLLAKLIAMALHATVIKPRPFVITGVPPLLHVEPDNGFPSDHALQAGALLVAAAALEPVAAPAYALAGALTLCARLGAGVHHTGDVLGGLGLAGIAAAIVYRLPVPAAWRAPLWNRRRAWRERREPARALLDRSGAVSTRIPFARPRLAPAGSAAAHYEG